MPSKHRAHYTIRTGKMICEQIAIGRTLQQALDFVGYLAPSIPVFHKWLEEFPAFREQYDRARQLQADMHADRIAELGEEVLKDPKAAAAYRTAGDMFKWSAEVRNTGKYGRKAESKVHKPLEPEKLRAEIKRLEKELGIVEGRSGEVGKLKVVK